MSNRILLIDFDARTLARWREVLGEHGYNVVCAKNSAEATQHLDAPLRPGLVVLEPMMPGLDGFTLCRTLKSSSAGRPPAVVIASRIYRGQKYRGFARDAGADLFIEKPIGDADLVELVSRWVDPDTTILRTSKSAAPPGPAAPVVTTPMEASRSSPSSSRTMPIQAVRPEAKPTTEARAAAPAIALDPGADTGIDLGSVTDDDIDDALSRLSLTDVDEPTSTPPAETPVAPAPVAAAAQTARSSGGFSVDDLAQALDRLELTSDNERPAPDAEDADTALIEVANEDEDPSGPASRPRETGEKALAAPPGGDDPPFFSRPHPGPEGEGDAPPPPGGHSLGALSLDERAIAHEEPPARPADDAPLLRAGGSASSLPDSHESPPGASPAPPPAPRPREPLVDPAPTLRRDPDLPTGSTEAPEFAAARPEEDPAEYPLPPWRDPAIPLFDHFAPVPEQPAEQEPVEEEPAGPPAFVAEGADAPPRPSPFTEDVANAPGLAFDDDAKELADESALLKTSLEDAPPWREERDVDEPPPAPVVDDVDTPGPNPAVPRLLDPELDQDAFAALQDLDDGLIDDVLAQVLGDEAPPVPAPPEHEPDPFDLLDAGRGTDVLTEDAPPPPPALEPAPAFDVPDAGRGTDVLPEAALPPPPAPEPEPAFDMLDAGRGTDDLPEAAPPPPPAPEPEPAFDVPDAGRGTDVLPEAALPAPPAPGPEPAIDVPDAGRGTDVLPEAALPAPPAPPAPAGERAPAAARDDDRARAARHADDERGDVGGAGAASQGDLASAIDQVLRLEPRGDSKPVAPTGETPGSGSLRTPQAATALGRDGAPRALPALGEGMAPVDVATRIGPLRGMDAQTADLLSTLEELEDSLPHGTPGEPAAEGVERGGPAARELEAALDDVIERVTGRQQALDEISVSAGAAGAVELGRTSVNVDADAALASQARHAAVDAYYEELLSRSTSRRTGLWTGVLLGIVVVGGTILGIATFRGPGAEPARPAAAAPRVVEDATPVPAPPGEVQPEAVSAGDPAVRAVPESLPPEQGSAAPGSVAIERPAPAPAAEPRGTARPDPRPARETASGDRARGTLPSAPEPLARAAPDDGGVPVVPLAAIDRPLRVVEYERPVMPEAARRASARGRVFVQVLIGPDGSVLDTKTMMDPGHGLAEAAVRSVRGWRYTRPSRDRQPVRVWKTEVVEFTDPE